MDSGDWLGKYKIVRKIGEGGMGEVFLADDPKLNRRIAAKILSSDFAADNDRMLRFIHEAISASSLNHPNIITIHEINDETAVPFIAMEFVDGETLGRRMKTAPLTIHETLDIAIQIATALSAAHEASVVHRDIKPDNVILRPDGLVKVVDFGLAKQVESNSDPDVQLYQNVNTRPGLVMGTVAYMSPEQARGKLVDARSDIFSFGSVLYQMVSGRLPFIGENDMDVVGSILHKDPKALSESAREVPEDIELVIRKALRKDREERYQTMREMLADLKDIREDLRSQNRVVGLKSNGSGSSALRMNDAERGMPTERMDVVEIHSTREVTMAPSTISGILISGIKDHPVRSFGLSLLLVTLFGGLLFGGYKLVDSLRRPESFQTMQFEKLTFGGNIAAEQAAVSPDGKYFAYVTQDAGEQSLWVKQTATDSNLQIVTPQPNRYNGLTFSPDASRVYFTVIENEGPSSLYQVPALGGPARKIVSDAKGPIAFSPDGKSIVFVRKETSLIIANADGTDAREVTKPDGDKRWLRMSFSPDGSKLAAAYFSGADAFDHLSEINVADGAAKILDTPTWLRIRGVAWLADGNMLVSGRDRETQYAQVWMVDPASGSRRRITNDLNSYQGISVTADGNTIISTQQNSLSNIWVSDENGQTTRVTSDIGKSDGMSGIAATPDGRILYTTRIKGVQDIWIVDRDGSDNRQLTVNSGSNFSPVASPDGKFVIFTSTRSGNSDLWKMNVDGSEQTRLTDEPGLEFDANITPDGKWIVYQYNDPSNKETIKKISVDGTQTASLTSAEAIRPSVSSDGRFVVCFYKGTKGDTSTKTAILPINGGEPVKVFDIPALTRSRSVRFSANGTALIYIESKDQVDNLWSQPIEGGAPRQLTNFTEDRIFRFDLLPQAGQFAFARGTDTSDAVMISAFR